MPGLGLGLALGATPTALSGAPLIANRNKTYTQLLGALADPWHQKDVLYVQVGTLAGIRRANVPNARTTTYYFAAAGNDSGTGSSTDPFQTRAKAQTLLTANVGVGNLRLRFLRGDTWRDQVNWVARDFTTCDTWGSGAKPIWTNFIHQYAASSALWTVESGTTYKLTEASSITWLKYADNTLARSSPLQLLTTKAAVIAATIPSFAWVQADGKIYLNLQGVDPNGSAWESNEGIASPDNGIIIRGDNVRMQGIVAYGIGMRTNAGNQTYTFLHYADAATNEGIFEDCESYYGGYHPFGGLGVGSVAGITTLRNCRAGLFRGDASYSGKVFVFFAANGGCEGIVDGFVCESGMLWESGQTRRQCGGYSHTTGGGYHSLLIARNVTYLPGDYSSQDATYFGGLPDINDDHTLARGFSIRDNYNDPTRWGKINARPASQVQLDCYFNFGCYDVLGAGQCQSGFSIDSYFIGNNINAPGAAYGCMWVTPSNNLGGFINCYIRFDGKGTIFDNADNASAWPLERIVNTVMITKDPASSVATNDAAPNISKSASSVKGNAYWCQTTVTANANVVPSGTDGLGLVTVFDSTAVILTGTPPAALVAPAAGTIDDAGGTTAGYWGQPPIDYNGAPRGTEVTIGPLTSGYTSGTVPSVPTASQLLFAVQPAAANTNTAISPAVTVRAVNLYSNLDATYTGNVSVSINSGTGTLSGTKTQAAVAGVATFNDLKIDSADTFTLAAKASGLNTGLSASVVITVPFAPTDMTNMSSILLRGQWYGNTDCSTGGLITSGSCKGWKASTGPNFTEGTNPPTIVSATGGLQGGASTQLIAASNITLAGDFTAYLIGTIASSKNNCFVANTTSGKKDYLGVYTDNNAYAISDDQTTSNKAVTLIGRVLMRFARNSGTITFTATGIAEATMTGGNSHTLTLASLFKSDIVPETTASLQIEDVLISSVDKRTSTDETNLLAWIAANREGLAF